MFRFVEKVFIGLISFGGSLASNRIKCISLSNWPFQAGPVLIDINSNKHLCYLFTAGIINCGGRCTTIDDQCAQISVLNKLNVKAYDLMLGINVTSIGSWADLSSA